MLAFFAVIFALLVVGLTGWTISTLATKNESREPIQEELSNMFKITKMLFVSIKSLTQILKEASFPSKSDASSEIDEQLLKFVPPISDKQEENKAA